MAEFHFQSMEAPYIESDVTIQLLVGGLVPHFAGILHVSCSVQKIFKNFVLLWQLKNLFHFGGKYDAYNFFANLDTRKRLFLKKMCVD
jgi:hypothetical protein